MARKPGPLATYNKKRDFTKTAEPAGKVGDQDGFNFMVQKHDATRLHYDFRLELDGTLKSWAVTRGPSLDPNDKRLAVRTEDHPLSYATFEGTIPKGQYGGGTVMLWDRGTWTPHAGKDPRKTLAEGHLHFSLDGERMKGEWVMFRLKPRSGDRTENWILRKVEDEHAGSSAGLTEKYLTSIKTGRTMIEIADGKKAKLLASWTKPPRRGGPAGGTTRRRAQSGSSTKARSSTRPPPFREPQKATLVDAVPAGTGWIHEMKFDGYRCLLGIGGGKAKLYTRSGLDWADKFPEIAEAALGIEADSALLDGEIVKLDDQGRSGFSALQQAISEGGRGLTLFLFDALQIDGEDLTRLPNIERKQKLASLLGDGRPPFILYADHIVGHGEKLFDAMCEAGQEGIISKRADALYRGTRTKSWLKVKCTRRQEFVIIGWSESDKKSRAFRALLLGLHEDGKLRYAGKVGTGFSMAVQQTLIEELQALQTDKAPAPVPRPEARGAHWVKPQLVAEVAFAEFTADNVVRHASFLGLRSDKKASAIVAETPQPLPGSQTDAEAEVKITNPDRLIFPDGNVTKGQLADYYRQVGALMSEWTANRPISLVRCPQGREKKCFFQKHDAGSFGKHVHHVPIREKNGKTEDYLYVADVAGILACVQMGTIEFHGWGSKVDDVERPDRLIFDLDPDIGLGFDEVKRAARDLHRHLADMGLQAFPLLTGGKGLHLVVPLTPKAEWPEVKDFAQRFAIALATAEPDRFTANMAKAKRSGRIFLDYLRNQRGATAIMPYSARAREGAPVSAPVSWDELDDMTSGARFTVKDVELLIERASARPLQGWGEASQVLPNL
ncbi:DNA ligase D [Sphingosinicella rhizophila]|uniref:DNA ligase (ATP) n=1 Tax=Sphingosinicella rhizophila TaxID=3050082 RepID=A0ABU3Q244_9SPHN|nr:DNA ligase D [Sphingosinicella sp. GR2756]MDT9597449.1 DNA ligase D [Sphingosinicella sp. GR2756]